jgi:hypothetical protein
MERLPLHWPVMLGKNPPDGVLINRGPERQIDLMGDVRTSPGQIGCFISRTARIKSAVRPFGPGFVFCFGENSGWYFRFTNAR